MMLRSYQLTKFNKKRLSSYLYLHNREYQDEENIDHTVWRLVNNKFKSYYIIISKFSF
jgi:hypothetical protein